MGAFFSPQSIRIGLQPRSWISRPVSFQPDSPTNILLLGSVNVRLNPAVPPSGLGTIYWFASDYPQWLILSPRFGAGGEEVVVFADTTKLPPDSGGCHRSTVTFGLVSSAVADMTQAELSKVAPVPWAGRSQLSVEVFELTAGIEVSGEGEAEVMLRAPCGGDSLATGWSYSVCSRGLRITAAYPAENRLTRTGLEDSYRIQFRDDEVTVCVVDPFIIDPVVGRIGFTPLSAFDPWRDIVIRYECLEEAGTLSLEICDGSVEICDPPQTQIKVEEEWYRPRVLEGPSECDLSCRRVPDLESEIEPRHPAGDSPTALASGDFDGDGRSDLAVANWGGDDVSILLAGADGSFAPPANYPVGKRPAAICVEDLNVLNGVGRLDVAVASGDGSVCVLLGEDDGLGGFTRLLPCPTLTAGAEPTEVVAAQLNDSEDDFLDLAVASRSSPCLSVFFGEGDGTFSGPLGVNCPEGGMAESLDSADLNGDDHEDLVVSFYPAVGGSGLWLFLGNGDGTFGAGTSLSGGPSDGVDDVAAAHLNDDELPDLVCLAGGFVWVLLARGSGDFEPVQYEAPTAGSLAVADLDDDGAQDIVTAGDDYVSLLRGQGDGSFAAWRASLAVGATPQSLTTGDFDGDTVLDIAVGNFAGGDVSVLLGGRGFAGGANVPAGALGLPTIGVGVRCGDRPRYVAVPKLRDGVTVLLSEGDCAFAVGESLTVDGFPVTLAVEDLNGDGRSDVAVAVGSDGEVPALLAVFLRDASGTFLGPTTYPIAGSVTPLAVAAGMLTGDELVDLAILSGSLLEPADVWILPGTENGAFGDPLSYRIGAPFPTSLVVGDLNADCQEDLVVGSSADGGSVLLSDGSGRFEEALECFSGIVARDLADVDGDGDLDLVGTKSQGREVSVVLWEGQGATAWCGFSEPVSYPVGEFPLDVVTEDIDQDGLLDLAVAVSSGNVAFLMGAGGGRFHNGCRSWIPTSGKPRALAVMDCDRDGRPDLLSLSGAGIHVLRDTVAEPTFRRGDANADCRVDLSDAVFLFRRLFASREPLPCEDAADMDDTGALNLTDGVYLLEWLYRGGPPLPPPDTECGDDPTEDALDCAAFGSCMSPPPPCRKEAP